MYAQACANQSRVYANSQFFERNINFLSTGTVNDPSNAVDEDPFTSSNLYLQAVLGADITQFLEFRDANKTNRKVISGPNTIYVKLSLPSTFLNAGGAIEIGTFRYTTSGTAKIQTLKYNGTTVVGLVGGPGTVEIPVQLTSGEQANGIYVKLTGGILSIPISTDIYGAYILENTTQIPDCDKGIDVISGLSDNSVLPIGSAFGSVSGEASAIDASPYTTYASLSAGLNVLNSAYLTAVFARASVPGDSAKVIIENLGGGLNLFGGLGIQTYLGANGLTSATTASGIVSKSVPGYPNLTEISFAVNSSFDRVRISYGGALGISGSVRVYNVTKVIPKPVTLIDGALAVTKDVCFAVPSTVLSVNNIQSCTTYNWYADQTTTTSLHIGPTYTLTGLSVGTHTYYVQSKRDNCTASISERVKVTINVNPLPIVSAANTTTCSGSTATLYVDNPVTGIAYRWYDLATNGTLLTTATTYSTPVLTANRTYYVEAYNTTTGCISSSRSPVLVTVKPLAAVSATAGTSSICIGSAGTLSNSTPGGTWSSVNPAVAIVSASGVVTGVSAGSTTIRYTIADSPSACAYSSNFPITVNNLPELTLGADPEICAGFISSSLSYTNSQYNPVSYSITWSSTDFTTVTDQPLPANKIPFDVPAHIAPGTYPGVLTLKNDRGCSTSINFNLKVNQRPPAPHVLVPISSQY
ncbi:hypothetical protein AB669_05155 [Pedobacter sp. BMA]|nr:hypothetical protein AB669_05155 [Pedobacter sp. BMA]